MHLSGVPALRYGHARRCRGAGVSAPAAYGITLLVLEVLVQHVGVTGKVCVADLAETHPEYGQDNRTARVAARLAYHLLRRS
ncbi:Formimidoylglutamase [Ralstonia condita]|uniref:Formimidoylglutamase n=1 Tax=Ralstonia condita TaxID=3058600 RepID=A0ABN9I8V2_9RALS|nr:Formimidoylglutamase [Ralstonia sp. LMG 7141]